MELTPLIFEPWLVPKLWGGNHLEKYGKTLNPGERVGESWEIFDSPQRSAVVAEGPWMGRTLNEIMLEHGPRLLGQAVWERQPERFPVMIKLIDACDDLSLQAHPDDDLAALLEGPEHLGKDETMLVLEADPGASMVVGLKAGVSVKDFANALRQGKPEVFLERVAVSAGDVVDVPAGRLHALGKGCVVAEASQNSELTYRVWDWGRLENGLPRALHIDKALRALEGGVSRELSSGKGHTVEPGARIETLSEHASFVTRRLSLDGLFRPRVRAASYHILVGLNEQAVLESSSASAMMVTPGRAVLVPASVDFSLRPYRDKAKVLWIYPPV